VKERALKMHKKVFKSEEWLRHERAARGEEGRCGATSLELWRIASSYLVHLVFHSFRRVGHFSPLIHGDMGGVTSIVPLPFYCRRIR
jgi:hypothetical protein